MDLLQSANQSAIGSEGLNTIGSRTQSRTAWRAVPHPGQQFRDAFNRARRPPASTIWAQDHNLPRLYPNCRGDKLQLGAAMKYKAINPSVMQRNRNARFAKSTLPPAQILQFQI